MFQKCPVCEGKGYICNLTSMESKECDVCNGSKIISELTGLPPRQTNEPKDIMLKVIGGVDFSENIDQLDRLGWK